jgi:pimeloyl-ACP methyl ester carboxylesterase
MDRMSSMRKLMRLGAETVNVFAYDRRGYAGSLPLERPALIADHISDLVSLIDFLDSEHGIAPANTVLFGHSIGGVPAIGAGIQVGAKATCVFETSPMWLPQCSTSGIGGGLISEIDDPSQFAEAFMRKMVGNRIWEKLPRATKQQRMSEGATLRAEMVDVRVSIPWDWRDITLPFGVGYGGLSREHQIANSKLLASLVEGCLLVELPDARHGAHLDNASELYAQLIQPLLA